jgi:starch-binding outer membrane protein, SusD/RagB family
MKNINFKIKITGLILGFWLILVSCSKEYLNRQPQGSINEETLATKDGVNGLLIGAYSYLDGFAMPYNYIGDNEAAVNNWNFGGIASDDAYKAQSFGKNAFQEDLESYRVDPSNVSVQAKWYRWFSAVQRANDVLRMLEKVPAGELTDEERTQIKAEAIFLRGVCHLELAKVFVNIPFVDETVSFGNGNYKVSNTTPVMPLIQKDFEFAAASLSETKKEVGRANKWAAKAFLAKTLIFQHKYPEARTLLTDIIEHGVTSLGLKYGLGNFEDNFNAATKNNKESVFAVQFSVNDNADAMNGNYGDVLNHPIGGTSTCCGAYHGSFSLVNSFKTDPVTGLPLLDTWNDEDMPSDMFVSPSDPFTPYSGTVDSRLDWTVGRRGIPYLDWGINPGQSWSSPYSAGGPYIPKKNSWWQKDKDKYNQKFSWADNYNAINYVMIRFADVLLWAAEVEIEAGSLAKAEEYVNRVRDRAADPSGWVYNYIDDNDPLAGFSNVPAANYKVGLYAGQFTALGADFARKATRFERKLELAMEGHRFFDLRRYDNGSGYMANVLNAYIQHETNIPGWNFLYMNGATFIKGKNELFPIPQVEIDASMKDGKATLIQNPGY